MGLEYVETSARESFGVDIAFILLLCNIHERLKRLMPDPATHKAETGTVSKLLSSLSMNNKKVRFIPVCVWWGWESLQNWLAKKKQNSFDETERRCGDACATHRRGQLASGVRCDPRRT